MAKPVSFVLLGVSAILQVSLAVAGQSALAMAQPAIEAAGVNAKVSSLPPAPKGKSTILGGEIQNVDPVRDQLTLKVFGQHPLKILFDERTQVFLDGKQIPLHSLSSTNHASIQTVLDGTDVFALSIHTLSRVPEGEYEGRVLHYDPTTRELTLGAAVSNRPIKLIVPANAQVVRQGQDQFKNQQSGESDLVSGSLVSVEFAPGKQGGGVASRISVVATPGSTFIFTGRISSLDMHTGSFILVDPQDDKSYHVYFNSAALPTSEKLHEGDHLRVTATFDGNRYVASALTMN
jgi:hypothetical protein